MRIKPPQDNSEDPLNMTPMIDMVFNLLIFFLVATTLSAEEREHTVQLPTTGAPQALSQPPKELIINIDRDGSTKVNGKTVERDALRTLLAEAKAEKPPRNVLIRADQESIHRYFAGVAALCHEVGISNLNIGYVFDKPKEP